MSKITAHVINHTHWDREWFLTSIYTSRWIPGLIDKLEELFATNPNFRFLFDGQTLVMEDLVTIAPDYRPRVEALISTGKLTVGPYYCQPDWQLTGGELLIRNLLLGQADLVRYGGQMRTGWMVDTFGHISQSPQIHQLFGINAAFVWRGVPELAPYFRWIGADGSRLFAVDLFGGYRNLYGVTHAPTVAATRLNRELRNLLPYYPTPDVPLFDGYDLEDSPEDPIRFYAELDGIEPGVALLESTPATFVNAVQAKLGAIPEIRGELNSGKYGATFPGTFSARTYLKIMARDCEHLLFRWCEPLGTLAYAAGRPYAGETYEAWARLLLQNAVHDCICGVSIDQVHERMEYSYRETFAAMQADIEHSLAVLLADFTPGLYAVSTNPFEIDIWQPVGDQILHLQTNGVGVWPVTKSLPITRRAATTEQFVWQNDHYHAAIGADGLVRMNDMVLGRLDLYADHGDTYSDERGEAMGRLQPIGPITLEETSEQHAVLAYPAAWRSEMIEVTAAVRLFFDASPLVRWEVELDSRGVNFSVELVFETGLMGQVFAGMPFDTVPRPFADDDLLGRTLSPDLAGILLGQREIGSVSTFPFQEYVAITDGMLTLTAFAKGIRSYRARPDGALTLMLRRAVEWVTEGNLAGRMGDAGPFFYVPDARCERTVHHEVAVAVVAEPPTSMTIQRLNALYQNPPLVVDAAGNGGLTSHQFLAEDLPMSALSVQDGVVSARFYNPTEKEGSFATTQKAVERIENLSGASKAVDRVSAKGIVTTLIAVKVPDREARAAACTVLNSPEWRVGENMGQPDTAILAQLTAKIDILEAEAAAVQEQLVEAEDSEEKLRLEHRYYVLRREALEYQLSHLLNRRKLEQDGALNYIYLYEPDPEIAAVGLALNRMRIKRRIFDYVNAALA